MKNFISLFFLLVLGNQALGQDTFYVKLYNSDRLPVAGCASLLVNFNFEYKGQEPDSVKLYHDGKQFVGNNDWLINGNKYSIARFLGEGVYKTQAKIYRNGFESTLIGNTITVYKNPEVSFDILSDTFQCFSSNEFCLVDSSEMDSGSVIIDWGDGSFSRGKHKDSFCHKYPSSGSIDLVYTITDKKGCRSTFVRNNLFEISPEIAPRFNVQSPTLCGRGKVSIKNSTRLDTGLIESWYYQIGDFKTFSFDKTDIGTKWISDSIPIFKDGIHNVKVVVESTDGCKDSLILKDAIKVFNPDLNVEMLNTTDYLCLDDTVHFKWDKSETVDEFLFVFGNPSSIKSNVESENPNPSHKYVGVGGSYVLELKVENKDCNMARDTTICCVNINGPGTATMLAPPPAYELKEPVYNKNYLNQLNKDSSLNPLKTDITYWKKVPGLTIDSYKVDTIFRNMHFGDGRLLGPSGQQIKYPNIKNSSDPYGYFVDTIPYQFETRKWERGTAIPKWPMFFPHSPGISNTQIHDTLVHANPKLDSLTIKFSNFTSKFRAKNNFGNTGNIWIGFDSQPFLWNKIPRYETESLPYVSDSLEYFWEFNDPEGQNCISTKKNQNPYCNYSREKFPTHTFKSNGCFNVKLTATDTVTSCAHTAIQPIVFEKPLASYDTSKYSEMDWYKQQDIIAKTGSLEGLGLVLDGNPCLGNSDNAFQFNVLLDGIKPSCGHKYYEVVFDAEQNCKSKKYIRDNNGSIIDSTYADCNFIPKNTLRLIGNIWSYSKPGWKTIGLVIFNNYRRDTFFYKDYIYINDLNTQFNNSQSLLDSLTQTSSIKAKMIKTTKRELDSIESLNYTIKKIADVKGYTPDSIVFFDSLSLNNDGFVNLNDSIEAILGPGKYLFTTKGENINGCSGAHSEEIRVGHLASFRIEQACAGGKTQFIDSVYYWHSGGQSYCQITNWWENTTCIDTNAFFYKPEDNTQRKQWQNNSGYTLPKFRERVAWDFTNDGTIDLWDVHTPEHIYQDPGNYECALWSMDSLGQWQKTVKTVEVPGAEINVSLADPSQKFVCAPDTVIFKVGAQLYNDDIESIEFLGEKYYLKDSFDVVLPIYNNTSAEYIVKALTKTGCLSVFQDTNLVTVFGPKANFNRITDPQICIGQSMLYESTGDTGKYQWFVNGNLSSTKAQLDYTATKPGLYSDIRLQVSNRVKLPENQKFKTCISTAIVGDSIAQKATTVQDSNRISFVVNERLEDFKVSFKMVEPDPYFHDILVTVNGSRNDTLQVSSDSVFTIGFNESGNYSVCTYIANQICTDTFCKSIWVDALSTDDFNQKSVELFPNPTSGNSSLLYPFETGTYRLLDLTGRLIKNGLLTKGNNEILTDELPDGVYILNINNGKNNVQKRIIKN